jgi:hypothetical protein
MKNLGMDGREQYTLDPPLPKRDEGADYTLFIASIWD